MNEEKTTNLDEQNFRINIRQNTKGQAFFDVTVRGQDEKEVSERLDRAIEIAVVKCQAINQAAGINNA